MPDIHVLKFGGSSLQNSSFIQQATEVVCSRAQAAQPVVVVSAMGGVTDQLVELTDKLRDNPELATVNIDRLNTHHHEVLIQLVGEGYDEKRQQLDLLFDELRQIYFSEQLRGQNLESWRDHVLSFGERASAHIFAAALRYRQLQARALEAHHFIKTDDSFGEANVLADRTRELIAETVHSLQEIAVITGFIGSTEQGAITTLGRSGSDYTAGLVADALEAEHLEIWTDVDGVLTADPKVVPTARHIDKLSYDDISELSAHGAKVIHPKTIRPIRRTDTSVQVRNSFNPSHPGTLINRSFKSNGTFRSITVTGPFTYFEVDSTRAHVLGYQLQKELEQANDSEAFSFSTSSRFEPAHFLIRESLYERIESTLDEWLERENASLSSLQHNLYKVKKFTNRLNQNDQPVIQILNMLTRKGTRPLRIQREHNQRYVSLLLTKEEAYTTARLINDYLIDERTTVELFVAGQGAVGGTLLEQLRDLNTEDVRLRIIGVCNSKHVHWNDFGIDTRNLDNLPGEQPTDWAAIIQELTGTHRNNTIFVDATGSEEVARLYPSLLKAGVHIATPSKLANTFEQSFYDTLHQTARTTDTHYRYETTVGAGLPIISTINSLLESGDTITRISGVFSGTMTYLFHELEKGSSFSQAVVKARNLGYAEPDPRDDLSGEDVARKLLTLARTLGLKTEREQLSVESLIPNDLKHVNRDTFLSRLQEEDQYWKNKVESAKGKGNTLRYTGSLTDGQIEIGVREVPADSPLGQLKGTDNMVFIYTERYRKSPVIIQGPGAGKQVTAAGLLSDILMIAKDI